MLGEFVKDKVYYKIFDRSFKQSSHIYGKFKTTDATKLAIIEKNIKAVAHEFSSNNILILNQVHSNIMVDADKLNNFDANYEADGIVTTKKNLVICALTADCVPVMLASLDGSVIGVAHCGWRGAKNNIIKTLINMMLSKGARDIKAMIGPAIQQVSYEVDTEYYKAFTSENVEFSRFFVPSVNAGHYMFNLPKFVEQKLIDSGISDIDNMNLDTYSDSEKYPSYRRDCHEGKAYKENILSALMIR